MPILWGYWFCDQKVKGQDQTRVRTVYSFLTLTPQSFDRHRWYFTYTLSSSPLLIVCKNVYCQGKTCILKFHHYCTLIPPSFDLQWWHLTHVTREGPLLILVSKGQVYTRSLNFWIILALENHHILTCNDDTSCNVWGLLLIFLLKVKLRQSVSVGEIWPVMTALVYYSVHLILSIYSGVELFIILGGKTIIILSIPILNL